MKVWREGGPSIGGDVRQRAGGSPAEPGVRRTLARRLSGSFPDILSGSSDSSMTSSVAGPGACCCSASERATWDGVCLGCESHKPRQVDKTMCLCVQRFCEDAGTHWQRSLRRFEVVILRVKELLEVLILHAYWRRVCFQSHGRAKMCSHSQQ